MFLLRMFSIYWLVPSLIFRDRGVQGNFHVNPFGDFGEYNSLDSVSRNSRDFNNLQQNVYNGGQNHNVPSAYPVSGDFSNQMAAENINRVANEISPLDEWLNNPDSAPNFQEVINYYDQELWNYAPGEDLSLSGQNHQEETFRHVGSSQNHRASSNIFRHDGDLFGGNHVNLVPNFDALRHPDSSFVPHPHQNFGIPFDEQMSQYPDFHSIQNDFSNSPHHFEIRDRVYQNQDLEASEFNPPSSSQHTQNHRPSSNIFQPMYDGNLFGGNHVNLVPNFDAFRQPDSSFVPHPHQNFGIPSDEQMSQYPAFHSIQNDFSNSPHHFEMRDKVYQNQDLEVSDFNPASSSQYTGFFNADKSFDHRSNSIDDGTSKSPAETDKYFRERKEIFDILTQHFTRPSKKEAKAEILRGSFKVEDRHVEKIHQKSKDYLKKQNHDEESQATFIIEGQTDEDEAKMPYRLNQRMICVYTLVIEWEGSDSIKEKISAFVHQFENFGNVNKNVNTKENIYDISVMGITFMKIIAKKYSNYSVSENFENDNSLLSYTESFWNFCFTNEGETIEKYAELFTSLGIVCTQKDIHQYLYSKFSKGFRIPKKFFSKIKTKLTTKTNKQEILLFSWYFVFFRAIFYYPQLIFIDKTLCGNELKSVIEDGILYFYAEDEKSVQKLSGNNI
ncbi:hypothetical protein PPACK8108_LOCUS25068 [Phakopsora pachyrhizi]|uniref:Uncharacterized protein n=1 Tax=Phakopsora pachyrhizi TaxID=170000 RepID=A0AAV0BT02_PHAPC|nr:hypothetical protein PPACK8108_LOCUS25068 [Phakopsora pachyrhizi]